MEKVIYLTNYWEGMTSRMNRGQFVFSLFIGLVLLPWATVIMGGVFAKLSTLFWILFTLLLVIDSQDKKYRVRYVLDKGNGKKS